MTNCYVFVVDTNKYSGNFEREMCAFMTGNVGECGRGSETVEEYRKEVGEPLDFLVTVWDNGCSRPCTIWETPEMFNNGLGGEFRIGEEAKAQRHYQKECLKTSRQKVHPNDQEAHTDRWEKKSGEPCGKFPAYLSVGIYMARRPTTEEVEFLKKRADEYGKANKIKVTGFRLFGVETVTKELDL